MTKNKPSDISFEFFPPKDDEAEARLWRALAVLADLRPRFISVTYGAGGSMRQRTREIVLGAGERTGLAVAAHMTCVGQSRAELLEEASLYWRAGVRHIVALRGDMPDMASAYRPHSQGFEDTPEFITALKEIGDFEISVSAYPEVHPDSPSMEADLELLQRKIEAGASRAITQFAFESSAHIAFLAKARAVGIEVPIVPGIMPTTNFSGVARMSAKCGASVPDWLADSYAGLEDNLPKRRALATEIALTQSRILLEAGFDALHFYTLNQSIVLAAVCEGLGISQGK